MERTAKSRLSRIALTVIGIFAAAWCFAADATAQNADTASPFPSGRIDQRDEPRTVRDFLAKQRAEKAKKDYEELLGRGDELLELAGQLETAYEQNRNLSAEDRAKLDSVEKLAGKIRKSLGGDDDDDDSEAKFAGDKSPADVAEAVGELKEIAAKLVDELKRSTRFSISVVAIQSSNSVLKIVRFLRLKK